MHYTAPADCPYYLITRVSLSMTSLLKKELADNAIDSVKPAYLGVLMCLWTEAAMGDVLSKFGCDEGMKLSELGRQAGLEPSTMTGLIDRMERDGLVCRCDDPADRRAQKIHLTEKGGRVRGNVFKAVDGMLEKAFAGISPDQMEVARQILRQVLTNISKGSNAS